MAKHSLWTTGLTLAGASAALPSTTSALEPELYVTFGAFGSYTFGAEQPWGLGFDARAGATGGPFDRDCSGEPNAGFYYGGGALRFEWFPESHSRLLLVAQGGRGYALVGAHAEVGLGYRFGLDEGVQTLIGAELDYVLAALALRVDPLRGEVNPALGVVFPSVVMPVTAFKGCAVAGRPLRAGDGFARLPPITLTDKVHARTRTAAPPEVVTLWSQRAQTELASVPAFRELAEQLHVLGAPFTLIDRCHNAARDELHHAMLAANHCAALGGRDVVLESDGTSARPKVAGPAGMVRVAIESWVDGCLGEGVAAACAAEEALRTGDDDLRNSQQRIARDEAQHAQLAWDVLAWTLAVGGRAVREALHAVAEAKPSPTTVHANDAGIADLAKHVDGEPFGILSSEHQQALTTLHRERSLSRLHHLLAAG